MRNRECIKKPSTRIGGVFSEKDNFARISYPQVDNTRLTWFFYDNGRWVSMETTPNSTKAEDSGTWECNGNENFKIFAGNFTYMSDINDWVESTPEPDPIFSCVEKQILKNGHRITQRTSSYIITNVNKGFWAFNKYGTWQQIVSGGGKISYKGKWECDGESEYKIVADDGDVYESKEGGLKWEKPTADPENLFDCIENHFKARGVQIITYSDVIEVKITLTSSWSFYRPNSDNRQRWIEFENDIVTGRGDWACDGESNFTIKKDGGETFSSQTDDSDTQSEPTYDRTKFPLKKGSEGKEVIQLQNYLNKEIPANSLVIDGIFGDLTHNKLVQVQKNKGVL